jgi:hypothetical protein
MLSHWRGAPTPEALRDDTSAGSVLRALRIGFPGLGTELVTANHFDIDAFVGVWSLLNPEKALLHEELLREIALIGDFRELDLSLPYADEALKLVCWLNAVEKTKFYPPFGANDLEESEVRLSPPKFEYFLEAFQKVLDHTEVARVQWQEEYQRVHEDYQLVHSPVTQLSFFPHLGLAIIETPRPLHYYALFSVTAGFDIVLAMYAGRRYELEYKYTTWVDLASRPTLPRVLLDSLAGQLNACEQRSGSWAAEAVTDTGPILRLDTQLLPKKERYAHPFERPVHASSIAPEEIKAAVIKFFEMHYTGVLPKKYWSWEEVKRFGK